MHFSTLVKVATTAICFIASVEAAANIFPVDAVGAIAAVTDHTNSGVTHIYYQDRNDGDIKVLCTSTAPVRGGSETCLTNGVPQVIIPASEALFGTPLAALTIVDNDGQFQNSVSLVQTQSRNIPSDPITQDRVYYFKPDWTLGEYHEGSVPTHGTGCETCLDSEHFAVKIGTLNSLYAIGTDNSDAFRRRVGFISRNNMGTITEATFNFNTKKWSLATIPN
ncbi:hypothetical protein VKT23_016822 [Stygiomarasmius scandens]|uniref:Secreted protein n=1 Tax=Marasmiellus scandens TaxID=2682957 RepID=A0ABR1IWA1_9AGAR